MASLAGIGNIRVGAIQIRIMLSELEHLAPLPPSADRQCLMQHKQELIDTSKRTLTIHTAKAYCAITLQGLSDLDVRVKIFNISRVVATN